MTKEETIIIEEDRYKRQTLLWGDDGQAKLNNARVAVIGLGPQGIYASLCLASLGVGNIVLIDGQDAKENELFLDMPFAKGPKAKSLPGLLSQINRQINVEGYATDLESRLDQLALKGTDVIIDATNSISSKQLAIAYGREKNIPVLSTSSKWAYTKLILCDPNTNNPHFLMPNFEAQEQDPLMALALSGIITEEVKKLIFKDQNFLKNPIRYRLGSGYRFGFPEKGEELERPDSEIYSKLKVAFLGGAALGCWGAIAASMMGFERLDVFDYDIFESHNINRQVLAYDGVDKEKALHIAEKILAMSHGKTASTGFNQKILPGFTTEEKYDLVFDFVDNRYTRAVNSAYGINTKTPLISAGALPNSARWDVHLEGKTQCMDHLFNIYEEGRREEMIRRASCALNPNPSVVMSNAIAAVCAVLDTYTIFESEKFGEPFNGEQTYRSDLSKRFGTNPLKDTCDCYSKPVPDLIVTDEQVKAFAATTETTD